MIDNASPGLKLVNTILADSILASSISAILSAAAVIDIGAAFSI